MVNEIYVTNFTSVEIDFMVTIVIYVTKVTNIPIITMVTFTTMVIKVTNFQCSLSLTNVPEVFHPVDISYFISCIISEEMNARYEL
jgi:hypothetical protein